ncbi:hypothetical protein BST61_g5350 [Cercospora zeina]
MERSGLPDYSPVSLSPPWSLPQGRSAGLSNTSRELKTRRNSAPEDLSLSKRAMTPIQELRALTPDNPKRGLTAYVPATVDDPRALKARAEYDPDYIARRCYNDGIWHNHDQSAAKAFVKYCTTKEAQGTAIPAHHKDIYWDNTGTWVGDDALRKYADMKKLKALYGREKMAFGLGVPPAPTASLSVKAENVDSVGSSCDCEDTSEANHNVRCYTCKKCSKVWYCSQFCRKTQSHCYPDEAGVPDSDSKPVGENSSETKGSANSEDGAIVTYLQQLQEMQKEGQEKSGGGHEVSPNHSSKGSSESSGPDANGAIKEQDGEGVVKSEGSASVTNMITVPAVHDIRFVKNNHRTIEYQITMQKHESPRWVDGLDGVLSNPAWLAAIKIFWQ